MNFRQPASWSRGDPQLSVPNEVSNVSENSRSLQFASATFSSFIFVSDAHQVLEDAATNHGERLRLFTHSEESIQRLNWKKTGTFSDTAVTTVWVPQKHKYCKRNIRNKRKSFIWTKSSLLSGGALFNLATTLQPISLRDRSIFFDFPGTVGGNTWRSLFSKSRAIALLNNLYKEEGNIWMKTVSACRKSSFY